MSIEVIAPDQIAVEVKEPDQIAAVVESPQQLTVVTVAEQGPPGPPGEASIGGYLVEVDDPKTGDLLVFSGSAWVNDSKVRLTDGGNF